MRPGAATVVPRPRLFRVLDRAPGTTWLCGPPGSGKTALAASYAETRRRASAWYQVDAGDGDLATFFDSMGLLARQLAPAGRRAHLPAFTGAFAAEAATFTRRFFESFFGRCPRPFLLVLDDYDRLPVSAPLHEVFAELVAAVPPGCRVIVISRDEPPPSLSRVRSIGLFGIVGGAELRLTTAELKLLMRRRVGERDAGVDVETIARRSQGWAAGTMLLLDAGGERGIARANEPANSDAVSDYFAGEVLAKLTPSESRALLALALLPQVPGSAAVEVSEQPWADRLLERLSRRQCFVERCEAEETVYRFHPMFHEFLRARAATTLACEERRRILASAANHLVEVGQVEDAAGLLVEAQEWKVLERLVVDHAARLLRAGRGAVVLAWIDAMPAEVTRRSAWLAYWLGVCGRSRGFAFAREYLGRAALAFEAAGEAAALAGALAAMFETFFLEGDSYTSIDPWIDMALALVDEMDPVFAIATFRALFLRRPHDPRLPALRDRLHLVRADSRVQEHAIAAGLALAYYYAWMGEPVTAAALVRTARELTGATQDVVTLQTADYIEGVVAIKLGDGDLCEAAIQRGLDRAEITGMRALDFRLQTVGVYAARMHRDPGRVARRLLWMRDHLDGAGRIDRSYYHMLVGWDLAVRGEVDRAYREMRIALALGEDTGVPTIIALPTFLLAQLAGERGDADEAQRHIARTRALSEAMGSESMLFMTEMVEADLAFARGDRDEGLRLLRGGLERARCRRLRFYAGWRPSVMTRLCTIALEAEICVDYVQGLVRHHALVPDRPPLDVPNWPWAVEVRTLGGLRIRRDGRELRTTSRAPQRPLDLLRALIAFGGRHVPTARLTDALWPESEGDSGQQALDTNLLRLRRLLGSPGAVVVEDGRVSLDDAQCVTDAWQLERLLDRTEAALQRANDVAHLGSLGHDIVRLYTGPFLADSEHAWAVAPREHLRRRVLHALEGIGRVRERGGDVEGALASYVRGLDVDDLAEGFYQRAMRCYGALGRQAEGVALYQRCRRILDAQLGVEPSPDTQAIFTTLTAGRMAARV